MGITAKNNASCTRHDVADEASMVHLGEQLAATLTRPSVIWLRGDLGAGKSVLARAIIHALGVEGAIKSPTYTLIEEYVANQWRIAHLDLYRLNDAEELHYLGFRDLVANSDLLLIEWPEKALAALPVATLDIVIEYAGEGRKVDVCAAD